MYVEEFPCGPLPVQSATKPEGRFQRVVREEWQRSRQKASAPRPRRQRKPKPEPQVVQVVEVQVVNQAAARPMRGVTKTRKSTGHGFHLLASLCTGGIWTPMWAMMTFWHKLGPRRRMVTKFR